MSQSLKYCYEEKLSLVMCEKVFLKLLFSQTLFTSFLKWNFLLNFEWHFVCEYKRYTIFIHTNIGNVGFWCTRKYLQTKKCDHYLFFMTFILLKNQYSLAIISKLQQWITFDEKFAFKQSNEWLILFSVNNAIFCCKSIVIRQWNITKICIR